MKRSILKLSVIILSGIMAFSSCKKGENDPFLSLKSRDGRLAGDWTVTEMTQTTTNADGTKDIMEISGSKITFTEVDGSESTANEGTGSIVMTFEKDGTFERVMNVTIEGDAYNQSQLTTDKGIWFWADGNKELDTKNKEVLIMQTTSTKNKTVLSYGSIENTYEDEKSYSGTECPIEYIKLDKLANKEMVIATEGQSTEYGEDENTTESSEMEATLEKE